MKDLLEKTWNHYDDYANESFVITESLPILYFGNLDKFNTSSIKVLTAGYNPSFNEFPRENRFVRFPKWKGNKEDLINYRQVLNSYFYEKPYNTWFQVGFENLLQGLGFSFYPGSESTVLHTDMCTPLATDPTWSKIENIDKKNQIYRQGFTLWLSFILKVKPDIIICSCTEDYLEGPLKKYFKLKNERRLITFRNKKDGSRRSKEFKVLYYDVPILGNQSKLIFANKFHQMPLSNISKEQQFQIGVEIKAKLFK